MLGAWLNAAIALPRIGVHARQTAFSVLRPWVIIAVAALCAEAAGALFGGVWIDALASAASFVAVGFVGLRALASDSLRGVHMSFAQIMRRDAAAPMRSEST
jgi:hypothetical protein